MGHIYVRPAGRHGLSLVDDLKADALARMKAEGFAPAAVVETSPGNLQAWLKHGETLDEVASTRAAKLLAERFGGDPGSADWRAALKGSVWLSSKRKPEKEVRKYRLCPMMRFRWRNDLWQPHMPRDLRGRVAVTQIGRSRWQLRQG